ncbi:hypothetical protein M231_01249 [Tremella mesenterica]|uniref:Uncharacterized protein n=1 Tax=Tremella mesenterica TaxID=5217 RepID=A0A4Q1BTE5_TREME|nr:hypothetical protein M231_01249 [Tremella mesenterica]
MAKVEEVPEEVETEAGPSKNGQDFKSLRDLTQQLVIPEELLPSSSDISAIKVRNHRQHLNNIVERISSKISTAPLSSLSIEDQVEILLPLLRLYNDDLWCPPNLLTTIDRATLSLSRSELAIHLLNHSLRKTFTNPHPLLHPSTSRALPRPAGGKDAQIDFSDAPTPWKTTEYGANNVLIWCSAQLSSTELERYIGVLLPPTLVMMDDWDPSWRGKGVIVLDSWLDLMPGETMRRMGVDQILLKSLIHTLSLHANPPLSHVLPVTIKLVEKSLQGQGERRAMMYEEMMDKAIVQGWIYAPPGAEGKIVLIGIAQSVEIMCDALGMGILRWLKTIIPYLLQPLQMSPTKTTLPHITANLKALIKVMQTLRETKRIIRWRGQIMDMTARFVILLNDAALLGDLPTEDVEESRGLVRAVLTELEVQYPAVRHMEFPKLANVAPPLQDVIPVALSA